jgi:hypothetical protein
LLLTFLDLVVYYKEKIKPIIVAHFEGGKLMEHVHQSRNRVIVAFSFILTTFRLKEEIQMKKILIHSMIAIFLLLAGLLGTTEKVAADQVYHTEHLLLEPVNGAPLQSGFVNNIHPNGQIVFAHEVYQLNGAAPSTSYQVVLMAYPESTSCTGDPALVIPTAVIITNKSGNGKAEVFFAPEDVAPLHGLIFDIRWVIKNGETVDYQTHCTVVTLD